MVAFRPIKGAEITVVGNVFDAQELREMMEKKEKKLRRQQLKINQRILNGFMLVGTRKRKRRKRR